VLGADGGPFAFARRELLELFHLLGELQALGFAGGEVFLGL
jgi:hypothetical protein